MKLRNFKSFKNKCSLFQLPIVFHRDSCLKETENANKKCRKIIRQVKRLAPKSKIIIIGCYAQLKPFEISQIDGVDLVLGAGEKFNIIKHLDSLDAKLNKVHSCEIDSVKEFVTSYSTSQRKRSFLKIQDGCDYPCTCLLYTSPSPRDRQKSRMPACG